MSDFFAILGLESPLYLFLPFSFSNKVVFLRKSRIFIYFFLFLLLSSAVCGLCPLNMTVWFSSSCCSAFLCVDDLNSIGIKSNQIMIVNML